MTERIKKYYGYVWNYIIAFIFIVTTGGAWLSDRKIKIAQEGFCKLLIVLLIISVIIACLTRNEKRIDCNINVKKKIFVCAACSLTFLLGSTADVTYYKTYYLIVIFWLICYMLMQNDNRAIWKAFANITVVLAAISLFFYFFGTLFHIIPATGVTGLDWGTWDTESVKTYCGIYYEAQSMLVSGSLRIMRNCGMFSEAPMFNMVLCTALAAEVFLEEKINKVKIGILTVTVLTTLSTTGMLFLMVTLILYLGEYAYKKGIIAHHKKLFAGIISGGIVLGVIFIWVKTFSPSGTGSVNIRTDHLMATIKTFIENPIFGVGYQNSEAVILNCEYKQGISVGLTYFLACGGSLLGLVLFFPYVVNIIEAIKRKEFKEVCFETMFLMLFLFTAISGRPLLMFFIVYITVYTCENHKGQLNPPQSPESQDNQTQSVQ